MLGREQKRRLTGQATEALSRDWTDEAGVLGSGGRTVQQKRWAKPCAHEGKPGVIRKPDWCMQFTRWQAEKRGG